MLDEPTVGVDLQSREQILTLVRRCAEAGAAVIYSTHYMEEAERICDRVLLIDRGRLLADGSVEQLVALGGGRPRLELTYRGQLPEGWAANLPGVNEIEQAVRRKDIWRSKMQKPRTSARSAAAASRVEHHGARLQRA